MKKYKKLTLNITFLSIAILLVYYLIVAYKLKLNVSPDELLRYEIPLYIYQHGTLPVGTDKAVMLPYGNYSYAYYPQLLGGVLSALFMKVMSLFSTDPKLLLFAARWTSALMGIVTVYCVVQTCRLFTKNNFLSNMSAVVVGLLPQFVYLSAYVNNDIVAIAGVSIMIYALTLATKSNWNYKNSLVLALGIIICLLGYLNSVPFVLVGIGYAIFLLVEQIRNKKLLFKYGIWILVVAVIVVIVCVAPLYIRNYYLYHDFTGARVFSAAYQRWLDGGGKTTMHPYSSGIIKLIFNTDWIVTTFKSMVSLFGYMNVFPKLGYYIFYLLFFYTGLLFNIVLLSKEKSKDTKTKIFNCLMLIGVLLTIFLSMYRSVTTDYQPQGRYVLTVLPIFIIRWTTGMNKLRESSRPKYSAFLYTTLITVYAIISLTCVIHYVVLNSILIG